MNISQLIIDYFTSRIKVTDEIYYKCWYMWQNKTL